MEWDEAQTFPLETIRKLGQLGYMGSVFPEELGGSDLGYVEYSIIIEELSRVDGSVGIIVAAHTSLCSNHIFKMGNDEQRRRYLRSEEHTSELQSRLHLVCRLLLEKKKTANIRDVRL